MWLCFAMCLCVGACFKERCEHQRREKKNGTKTVWSFIFIRFDDHPVSKHGCVDI